MDPWYICIAFTGSFLIASCLPIIIGGFISPNYKFSTPKYVLFMMRRWRGGNSRPTPNLVGRWLWENILHTTHIPYFNASLNESHTNNASSKKYTIIHKQKIMLVWGNFGKAIPPPPPMAPPLLLRYHVKVCNDVNGM